MAVFSGNGSNTAPSFTFSSDTNTGMYRANEDILRLVTGGEVRLNIDGPASGFTMGFSADTSPLIEARGFTNTQLRIAAFQNNSAQSTTVPYGDLQFYSQDGSGPGAGVRASIGAIFTDTSGVGTRLAFSTSSSTGLTERMSISNTGTVEISTNATTDTFTVHSTSAGTSHSIATFESNSTDRMMVYANGDVLIGGTLPSSPNITLSASGTVTAVGALETGLFTIRGDNATTAVSTTDTVIGTVSAIGSMFLVKGQSTTSTDRFMDLVFVSAYAAPVVIQSYTVRATPAARTYSYTSFNFELRMASDTYDVRAFRI